MCSSLAPVLTTPCKVDPTNLFHLQLSEVEAHVTAPSGKHAVGVSVGVRTVNPLRHPTDAFNAASSQE